MRRGFNLNVGMYEMNYKSYVNYIKEMGATVGGVSKGGNLSNDYYMTSFVKLVKRAQNECRCCKRGF